MSERARARAAFIVNNCNKPRSLCARSSAWPRPRLRESGESLVGQRDSVGMRSARTGSTAAWRRVTRLGQLQFKPEKKKEKNLDNEKPRATVLAQRACYSMPTQHTRERVGCMAHNA